MITVLEGFGRVKMGCSFTCSDRCSVLCEAGVEFAIIPESVLIGISTAVFISPCGVYVPEPTLVCLTFKQRKIRLRKMHAIITNRENRKPIGTGQMELNNEPSIKLIKSLFYARTAVRRINVLLWTNPRGLQKNTADNTEVLKLQTNNN